MALKRSGVRRVVFLSSLGAEVAEGTGPIAWLHDTEECLLLLGIDLLILRPGYFYENFYGAIGLIKTQGINGGAIAPDIPVAMTATEDIGRAAAAELLGADFHGSRIRELLGPRDYTMAEATRILGAKIGKPDLAYVRFQDGEFVKGLTQAGVSHGVAEAFLELAQAINAGKVRSLHGRTPQTVMPTTLEAFADRFAAAYRAVRGQVTPERQT